MGIFVPNKYKGRRVIVAVTIIRCFYGVEFNFLSNFRTWQKMSSRIICCPTASFASASQLKKRGLRSCCCSFVYLLATSCTTRWVLSLLYSLESIFPIWRRSRSTPSMFTCILSTMLLHEIILKRRVRNFAENREIVYHQKCWLRFRGRNTQLLFAYNFYSFDISFWVKFCTDKLENDRRK